MEEPTILIHGILKMMIPIIAIVFGCSIAIVAIIFDSRRKKHLYALYHEERMAAINKGMEPPSFPDALMSDEAWARRFPSPQRSLRRGLVWLLLGISIYFVVRANEGPDKALFGLPVAAIGVANLIYYFMAGRKAPSEPPKNSETKTVRAV